MFRHRTADLFRQLYLSACDPLRIPGICHATWLGFARPGPESSCLAGNDGADFLVFVMETGQSEQRVQLSNSHRRISELKKAFQARECHSGINQWLSCHLHSLSLLFRTFISVLLHEHFQRYWKEKKSLNPVCILLTSSTKKKKWPKPQLATPALIKYLFLVDSNTKRITEFGSNTRLGSGKEGDQELIHKVRDLVREALTLKLWVWGAVQRARQTPGRLRGSRPLNRRSWPARPPLCLPSSDADRGETVAIRRTRGTGRHCHCSPHCPLMHTHTYTHSRPEYITHVHTHTHCTPPQRVPLSILQTLTLTLRFSPVSPHLQWAQNPAWGWGFLRFSYEKVFRGNQGIISHWEEKPPHQY